MYFLRQGKLDIASIAGFNLWNFKPGPTYSSSDHIWSEKILLGWQHKDGQGILSKTGG